MAAEWRERNSRGAFFKELDFVASDMALEVIGDFTLVCGPLKASSQYVLRAHKPAVRPHISMSYKGSPEDVAPLRPHISMSQGLIVGLKASMWTHVCMCVAVCTYIRVLPWLSSILHVFALA